jgi:hypothetical protein
MMPPARHAARQRRRSALLKRTRRCAYAAARQASVCASYAAPVISIIAAPDAVATAPPIRAVLRHAPDAAALSFHVFRLIIIQRYASMPALRAKRQREFSLLAAGCWLIERRQRCHASG